MTAGGRTVMCLLVAGTIASGVGGILVGVRSRVAGPQDLTATVDSLGTPARRDSCSKTRPVPKHANIAIDHRASIGGAELASSGCDVYRGRFANGALYDWQQLSLPLADETASRYYLGVCSGAELTRRGDAVEFAIRTQQIGAGIDLPAGRWRTEDGLRWQCPKATGTASSRSAARSADETVWEPCYTAPDAPSIESRPVGALQTSARTTLRDSARATAISIAAVVLYAWLAWRWGRRSLWVALLGGLVAGTLAGVYRAQLASGLPDSLDAVFQIPLAAVAGLLVGGVGFLPRARPLVCAIAFLVTLFVTAALITGLWAPSRSPECSLIGGAALRSVA